MITHALTLIQPWAHAVAHLGKDIENRTWPPPGHVIGSRIAIHAGGKLERDAVRELRKQHELPAKLTASALVCTARVVGWVHDAAGHSRELSAREARAALQSPWYICGHYGWVLRDVEPLRPPLPCRGKLSVWRLPTALEVVQ